MATGRMLIWIGLGLLVPGAIGYGAAFLYAMRLAYRPEDEPRWLDPLFTLSLAAGGIGLLLLAAGLIVRFRGRA